MLIQDLEDVIKEENLDGANICDTTALEPDQVVITREEGVWKVYSTDERASVFGMVSCFDSEAEACEDFIKKLRLRKRMLELKKEIREKKRDSNCGEKVDIKNNKSIRQLKTVRNLICVAGILGGFIIWILLPDSFQNSRLFHVGNGEMGSKYGALILLLIQLFAFLPDIDKPEFHTEDPVKRVKFEEQQARREALRQVYTALGLALTIWVIFGLAAFML